MWADLHTPRESQRSGRQGSLYSGNSIVNNAEVRDTFTAVDEAQCVYTYRVAGGAKVAKFQANIVD